jgi:hypothetical protein
VHYWDLRKEAHESWEHGVTNELVYIPDALPVFDKTALITRTETLAEIYLKGDAWIELQFSLIGERDTEYMVVAECVNAKINGDFDDHSAKDWLYTHDIALGNFRKLKKPLTPVSGNPSVLVEVAHSIETPEGMRLVGVPSVIRLKCQNLGSGSFRNSIGLFAESFSASTVIDFHDWELGAIRLNRRTTPPCQTPHKLIQTGSHVVEGIPDNETDIIRDIMKRALHAMPLLFQIIVKRDSVSLLTRERFQQTIQSIQMRLRPTQFQIGIEQAST